MSTKNIDSAITEAERLLDLHPDFKITRRITPRQFFAENDGRILSKGVVVDTETTGTSPDKDAMVELGMILFEFDPATGIAYTVLESFDQLEDPGFPIPAEATSVQESPTQWWKGSGLMTLELNVFLKA